MKGKCSPTSGNNKIDSCFNNNNLVELSKSFNTYISKQKLCKKNICAPKKPINITNQNDIDLMNQLKNRLSIFGDEHEWINLPFIDLIPPEIRNEIEHFTFKPKGPSKPEGWLSTSNIDQVIKQYIKKYKQGNENFVFLGAQPSDISRVTTVDWNGLLKKDSIAIVFNTDKHNKPGKHWLAVYIDNIHKTIEYFDSLGNPPNKYITEFLHHFKGYDLTVNSIEFQKGGSQCGVYATWFIIEKIKNKTFNEILALVLTDEFMRNYRHDIFI